MMRLVLYFLRKRSEQGVDILEDFAQLSSISRLSVKQTMLMIYSFF